MADEKKDVKKEPKKPLLAKKSFVILHNDFFRGIKEGDDLSDIPEVYIANLKTEGVL